MEDPVARANLDYLAHLADRPDEAEAAFEGVERYKYDHGARYDEQTISTMAKPEFLSAAQHRLLAEASRALHGALERYIEAWLDSPELQALREVPDEELELYRVDPGYDGAIQVARFDALLSGTDLAFLEFNCDSPGGAGYGDVIYEAFDEHVLDLGGFRDRHRLSRIEHRPRLVAALLRCWAAWREGRDRPSEPTIALVDWPDVRTMSDIQLTLATLRERGLDARYADPRDLDLDGDELVLDGDRVDLVYKRVILSQLLDDPDARPLVEAYRAGTVCMVNPPRSMIAGSKTVLAGLRHPEAQAVLTDEQRRAVDEHVPWTAILRDTHVEISGDRVDLRGYVLDHREDLVLKPARGYGGKQVHLGPATDEATWGKLVDDHIDEGDWIVQERVPIPSEAFPSVAEGRVRVRRLNVNVNPFVFGGEYAGAYTRVSAADVINVSAGGGIVPTITLEEDPP